MPPIQRRIALILCVTSCLALILGCSLPSRLAGETPDDSSGAPAGGGASAEGPGPVEQVPPPEPLVVAHQGDTFAIYSLDGALQETRPASGLSYARPNTAQVVGESIYYVDSSGSSLGGVVRRVTSEGVEALDFTAGEDMASVSFAVSDDESRIAWTHSTYGAEGVTSQLWIANIDGSDVRLAVESDPDDDIAEYYSLETVRWMPDGDLIYAWQVTGIGGYILFFGWSSFYRYDPDADTTTPLVPLEGEGAGPCWYALSPDGSRAAGGCGTGGMKERGLATGTETAFPVMADQGQQGGAAYSPSGARFAYAIARGNPDDELGQVLVRLSQDEEAIVLSTQAPGYFERILWADEDRMAVGYFDGMDAYVDLLGVDGARTPIGDGRLIGLMQLAPPGAMAPGLAEQVSRRQLEVERITSDGDYAGPGIKVVLRNPGPDDVATMIPCGLILEPDDPTLQRLMVVQPASAVVPAGGEVTLISYVVCIDKELDFPDVDASYTLGPMQGGDLLKLAECVCRQDLAASQDPFIGLKVMAAGWVVSSGQTVAEMMAEDESGDMQGASPEGMEEDIYGWLDRCNIPRP